jgi:hypothetical protein
VSYLQVLGALDLHVLLVVSLVLELLCLLLHVLLHLKLLVVTSAERANKDIFRIE